MGVSAFHHVPDRGKGILPEGVQTPREAVDEGFDRPPVMPHPEVPHVRADGMPRVDQGQTVAHVEGRAPAFRRAVDPNRLQAQARLGTACFI